MNDDYTQHKKLIIFGASEAGKTSLSTLFEKNTFNENEKNSPSK
jgi:GTPase SAR1 family protein